MTARRTGPSTFAVTSEKDETKIYTVSLEMISCNCPQFTFRCAGTRRVCKHVECAAAADQAEMEEQTQEQRIEQLIREQEEMTAHIQRLESENRKLREAQRKALFA